MTHIKALIISRSDVEMINNLIKNGGMSEKEPAIKHTATFPDGMAVDVMCCGADEHPAWTQAVFYDKDGHEISFTEPGDNILGEWEFKYGDDKYVVVAKEGGEDDE